MKHLVFFGTQSFGTGILEALLKSGDYVIDAVVTQPDRPIGREQEVVMSPAKQFALHNGLSVLQPENLKTFASDYKEFAKADSFVVCQYGLIIPQSVLDMPTSGTINVHTSLLPKYRGASPIQTALMNGETETGVTIMLMDAKLDHGPILSQEKTAIGQDDTADTLGQKLLTTAGPLLVATLRQWLDGTITPKPQDDTLATTCKLLSRDDGKLNFSKTANELYNLYRGTTPWPGVYTTWNGKRLKLLKVSPSATTLPSGEARIDGTRLFIGCTKGSLEVHELQLEGKKAQTTPIFIQGNRGIHGAHLDS
jgi:methionyl-tRNA formyltransferase